MANALMKLMVGAHVRLYRLTGGRIGGGMDGQRMLLLTTTGNKSGQPRTVPVMFFESDGRRFVVASNGGAPTHPAWFKNLEKTPTVEVQVGPRRYPARAEVLAATERTPVWEHIKTSAPRFAGYEKRAAGKREIPVVELKETPAG